MYLDSIRRKKRLRIVLWFVIISLGLSMLIFFVPGQGGGISGFDTSAASVDGNPILMKDFVSTYRRVLENYSAGGKNKLDPETIKALGLGRQALDALINVKVVNYAAEKLGLKVSPEEIRSAVESNPNLQDRGVFVGVQRYKALLAANNISISEFEEGLRFGILSRKIRNVISDSIQVTERELRDEFVRTTQEAQVRFIVLDKENFKKQVSPNEASVRAYFDANKDRYVIKEQRRAQYLLIPISAVSPTVKVTEQDIQEEWKRQAREENVDASHILFTVKDPAQEAEVKAKAEAILKRAKAGEDFAELAKKNSEDPGSATQGGNLGTFGHGRMVKEFEDVAFSLKPGEISDLVRTQFGYHIIKVLRHDKPDLEASRSLLTRTIQLNKASDLVKQKAAEAERLAENQKDLNVIAKALNIPAEVRDTGFFSKDSDPFANGISQSFVDEVFRLKEIGAIAKAVDHPAGHALPKLLEINLPKPPDFTLSRAAVEKDYIEAKARELMQAEAKKLSEEASRLGDIEKAAQQNKYTVKTSSNFKRDGAPDPEIGNVPQFNDAAFSLAAGAVSSPISLDAGNRMAVLQVKSRLPFNEAEFQKQKAELREKMLGGWRDAYFQEYIRRITENLEKSGKIRINGRAVDQVTG